MSSEKHDLVPKPFPAELKWSEGEVGQSLERLHDFACSECERAIAWYFNKKQTKRIAGYVCRVGSILALAVSGLIPIVAEIYAIDGISGVSPAWATVALVIMAVFAGLDRLGGYTSGWVRYVRTAQVLSSLQSDFRIEWEKLRLKLQTDSTDIDLSERGMDKCKEFLNAVHSVVHGETDQWAQEFQKFVLELDEKSRK